MQEVLQNVNEGWKQAEVVKGVLSNKTTKTPITPVGTTSLVNLSLGRYGGIKSPTMWVSQLTEGNTEAAQVEALEVLLKRIDAVTQVFVKSIVR